MIIIGAAFWLILRSFSLGLLEATRLPGFGVVGLVRFAGSKTLIFLALSLLACVLPTDLW